MLPLQSKNLCIIMLLCTHTFHSANSCTYKYCKEVIDLYKYPNQLHFLGEIGDLDFGLVNMTKTINCCAIGFTKIEWLKDNKPYPWSSTTSSFVVDENSFNQTLVSKKARIADSGLYTCILSNEYASIQRDIVLQILAPESAGAPRMTYATKDQRGNIGNFARLFCEGFVGRDKNGNFSGTVSWEKGLTDRYLSRAFIDGKRVFQIDSYRDENQIVSSYLVFMKVEAEDVNMYTCRIINGNHRSVEQRAWILDSQDPEELARMLFISIFAILPLFTIASILAFLSGFVLPMDKITKWLIKVTPRNFGKDERSKHILVVYHTNDESLMSKTIIPKFLDLYPIRVTLYPVHNHEEDFKILLKKAKTYHGVMVIMTHSLVGNDWSCKRIDFSIKVIKKLHNAFVCIFTRRLPPLKGKNGQMLRATLRKSEIYVVRRKSLSGKILKAYFNRFNKIRTKLCKPFGYGKK